MESPSSTLFHSEAEKLSRHTDGHTDGQWLRGRGAQAGGSNKNQLWVGHYEQKLTLWGGKYFTSQPVYIQQSWALEHQWMSNSWCKVQKRRWKRMPRAWGVKGSEGLWWMLQGWRGFPKVQIWDAEVIAASVSISLLTNKIYKWLLKLLPPATRAAIVTLILRLNDIEFSCFNEKADSSGKQSND